MGGAVIAVVVIAFVLLVVYGIVYSYKVEKKRREGLAAWAAKSGFSFNPENNYEIDSRFPGFDCLEKGRSRRAYNIMEGVFHDMELCAFDYRYVTGGGKNTTTVAQPSADAIARLAFQKFEERGHAHGSDVDDWLNAEAELTGRQTG